MIDKISRDISFCQVENGTDEVSLLAQTADAMLDSQPGLIWFCQRKDNICKE